MLVLGARYENVTNSLHSLLQDRANANSSNEQHAGNHEFTTRIGAVQVTPGGNGQCGDDCPLSCSCRTDIREVRNNLEASIGTHEDKFRQLRTSIHELRDEFVGLIREHTIKHEPINSASASSIAALTLDVSNVQREVAAVRLAIEGWEHEGVDEAKEVSDDESFQVCSSGRSGGHANRRTRSVESLSSAFYGRGQDNASKRSTSAPCVAKKNILGVVGDSFHWGDGERYTPSIFSRPHMLHRNITQGKLPTLNVPKPSVSEICRDVKSGEQGMLGTMFPYGTRSFGGNDDDELDGEYGEFGDEYQGNFSGDKNVSFGGDMVFENLESFDETKNLGEPDAGPERIQRKVRRLFRPTESSKPDLEALDDDTRKEVQKMLKCPKWNGDYKQWLALELLWRRFHDHWSRRCGADLMAKILITALPEAKRALYTELHMTMRWTYQQIWLDLAGRGRGLQSRRSLRRVWTASQPPPGKQLEKYGTWVLKWSLLLRKAMPVAADRAKEVFLDALVRHGEYGEELNEVYKWERIHGHELTVEGVHEILVYEIGWREDRDWAQHEDAAEVRRMHGG